MRKNNLTHADLKEINGGDNIIDCVGGLGAAATTIATAGTISGPIGWGIMGALGVAAAGAGAATGWSCTKAAIQGK